MRRISLAALALITGLGLALSAGLTGCESAKKAWSTRTLPAVRAEGDRAYEQGRYEQALAEYEEVLERDPADWPTRVKAGKTLLILGRPEQAREELAIAYTLRPEDEEIVELYAQAMLEAGDEEDLFRVLRQRTVDRQSVDEYLRLGRYAAMSGDIDEAERALLTAARLDEGRNLGPQMALAEFYLGIGDEEAGLERLRMCLYLDPENVAIQDRIRALGKTPGPSFAIAPEEMN